MKLELDKKIWFHNKSSDISGETNKKMYSQNIVIESCFKNTKELQSE